MVSRGGFRCGKAGKVRRVTVWFGVVSQGMERQARRVRVRRGMVRQARHGKERIGRDWQAGHGKARFGMVRQVRQGLAW